MRRGVAKKILVKNALSGMALLVASVGFSQKNDSVPVPDSLNVYKKIKKVAYKHRLTTLIYKAVFVDPSHQTYIKKPLSDKQTKEDPDLKFNGKVIQKIIIKVFDPFGFSVNDTIPKEI